MGFLGTFRARETIELQNYSPSIALKSSRAPLFHSLLERSMPGMVCLSESLWGLNSRDVICARRKWPNFKHEQKLSSKDFVSGWRAGQPMDAI